MDDKNKSALVFCLTGAFTGVIAGSFLKGMANYNYLILLVAVAIFYLTSRIVPFIGVNVVRLGGKKGVIKGGIFSFLMWWLLCWFITYSYNVA
ncbi:MAG: hypothetical protein U9N35_06640 [Euryarchaeota archaeon]|nr:hypothetical protein [Euryarchaeota archaeon]